MISNISFLFSFGVDDDIFNYRSQIRLKSPCRISPNFSATIRNDIQSAGESVDKLAPQISLDPSSRTENLSSETSRTMWNWNWGPTSFENSFLDSESASSLPAQVKSSLASGGSLNLPDHDVVDEFIMQYFKHVHPAVPVLDEADFWQKYQGRGEHGKISLFVFQALLFTSCPVSIHHFQKIYGF